MQQYIKAILPMALLLVSCSKDIMVTPPPDTSRLVINSITNINDTFKVSVQKSAGILQYDQEKSNLVIPDATVLLYANGQWKDTLRYNVLSGKYSGNAVALAGLEYTIKVIAPSFEPVSSTVNPITIVPLNKVERFPDAYRNDEGNLMTEVRITFTDPPAAGDIYLIRFMLKSTTASGSNYTVFHDSDESSVYTTDPGAESSTVAEFGDPSSLSEQKKFSFGNIMLRDDLFNGTTKELKLYVPDNYKLEPYTYNDKYTNVLTSDTVYIELQHIPESYYHFLKSLGVADYTNGDGFSEPVNVYTNITHGYGIFSIIGLVKKPVL